MEDFDDLLKEALDDREVRWAFKENGLRRRLAAALERARLERKLTVRELAAKMGTSTSQVQRLLHEDMGGSVTLTTICRAADALDLSVSVHVRPQLEHAGALVPFGERAWSSAGQGRRLTDHVQAARPAAAKALMQQQWHEEKRSSTVAALAAGG